MCMGNGAIWFLEHPGEVPTGHCSTLQSCPPGPGPQIRFEKPSHSALGASLTLSLTADLLWLYEDTLFSLRWKDNFSLIDFLPL